MANLLSPLDLVGVLVDPRRPGEDLASYRTRLLQVATAVTQRDPSEEGWVAARVAELSGRLGSPVRLWHAPDDPELLAEAQTSLVTWDRVAADTAPFRWAQSGGGRASWYSGAAITGAGVGDRDSLTPFYDPDTGRVFARAGYVVAAGRVWYVPARPVRVTHHLLAGTTETVVPPFAVHTTHGHSFTVVDEDTLLLTGSDDHTHTVTRQGSRWVFADVTGAHSHTVVAVDASGPAHFSTSPLAGRLGTELGKSVVLVSGDASVAVGAVPVVTLGPVPVTTDDGAHETWVDPHAYAAGTFLIGGDGHAHRVVDWVVEETNGHTHTVTPAVVAQARPLVVLADDGTPPPAELDALLDSPHVVRAVDDTGWTTLVSRQPLSEVLSVVYDPGARTEALAVPTPLPIAAAGHVVPATVGLGPALPATHVHVLRTEPTALGWVVHVRSEDAHTGGVPHQAIRYQSAVPAQLTTAPHRTVQTDENAVAQLAILRGPGGGKTTVSVDLMLDGAWAPAATITLQ